MTRQLYE